MASCRLSPCSSRLSRGAPRPGSARPSPAPLSLEVSGAPGGASVSFAIGARPVSRQGEVPSTPAEWFPPTGAGTSLRPPAPARARRPGSGHALPALGPRVPGAAGPWARPQHPHLGPELRAAEAGVPAEGRPVRGRPLPQQLVPLLQREAPGPLRVETARGESCGPAACRGRGPGGPGTHAPHAPATDRTCVCWHTRLVGCAGGPRGVGLHPPSALSPSEARPEGAGPSCSQDNSQETRPSGPRASLQTWRGPPNSSPCEVTLRPPCTGLSGFWPDTPSAGAQDRGEAPPLGGEPSAAQRPAGDGPMGASQCLGRGANVCCAALARARPLTQYRGSPSPGWLLWGQVTMGQAGTAKSQPLSCRERSP